MLCFIQITLKLSVMRLLQFLIPWNSTMNPLVVTSSWLSRMQKPYLGRAAGHRGCPWLNTSRYVLRLLISFLVWVYPKKSLPSKKSIKLLYLDTDQDTMLLTGFLDCANTNSNRRSYWSRKVNFDYVLPEIPSYSKSVGCSCCTCDLPHLWCSAAAAFAFQKQKITVLCILLQYF